MIGNKLWTGIACSNLPISFLSLFPAEKDQEAPAFDRDRGEFRAAPSPIPNFSPFFVQQLIFLLFFFW